MSDGFKTLRDIPNCDKLSRSFRHSSQQYRDAGQEMQHHGCMVVAGAAYIEVPLTFLLTAMRTCAAHHSFGIWDVI